MRLWTADVSIVLCSCFAVPVSGWYCLIYMCLRSCTCERLMCCPAGVWRLMGDVWSVSELNAFCPLMCAVTMETGVFAGTTEMAMLWLGGLMRARGLAVVPTGQLLTASFCRTKHTNSSRSFTLKPLITLRPLHWIKTLMVDLTGHLSPEFSFWSSTMYASCVHTC